MSVGVAGGKISKIDFGSVMYHILILAVSMVHSRKCRTELASNRVQLFGSYVCSFTLHG
jgi:hypothetical protein